MAADCIIRGSRTSMEPPQHRASKPYFKEPVVLVFTFTKIRLMDHVLPHGTGWIAHYKGGFVATTAAQRIILAAALPTLTSRNL